MRSTRQFCVTQLTEMAGDDASDRAVENWLRQEVVLAYDGMKADPSRGRSAGEVRTSLATEHEQANKPHP